MAKSFTEQNTEERHPMTVDQRELLAEDRLTVRQKVEEITVLVGACFGAASQVSFRAGEISSAIQRFEWELERQLSKKSSD